MQSDWTSLPPNTLTRKLLSALIGTIHAIHHVVDMLVDTIDKDEVTYSDHAASLPRRHCMHFSLAAGLVCVLCSFQIAVAQPTTPGPSFPGAVGWGASTVGGRGGRVLVVTTLEDRLTNPPVGSLRWAIQQSGPRTIVFAVGGRIHLEGELHIGVDGAPKTNALAKLDEGRKFGHVTIAGQSAPPPGITITGSSFHMTNTEQVILRHLRFRPGLVPIQGPLVDGDRRFDPSQGPTYEGLDGLGIARSRNVIIDHCSITWAADELMSIADQNTWTPDLDGADRVTIQHCLLAECFDMWKWNDNSWQGHDSGAFLIYRCRELRSTIWGNALWSNERRSPCYQPLGESNAHCRFDICGNVIGTTVGTEAIDFDLRSGMDVIIDVDFIGNRLTTAGIKRRADSPIERTLGRFYWGSNNFRDGSPIAYPPTDPADPDGVFKRMDSAFFSPHWVTTTADTWSIPARTGKVGAILPVRDHIDSRIHANIASNTVLLMDTQSEGNARMNELAQLPNVQNPTRHPPGYDVDQDGMKDSWESAFRVFSPIDDVDQDGYTNLEEFLNQTDPRVADR